MRRLVCLGLLAVVVCAVEARSLAESANTLSAGLSENINIQGAPVATSDGYQLDGGVKVTTAQLVALKSKLNVKGNTLTKPVTGFFRTTLRRCIQAMIKGFSPADMNEMLNAPGAQKTFGGAMAVSYFPVPSIETISPNVCYLAITVKSGTPKYDPAIVSAAGIQATTPGQIEALGALVGYYKQYDASTIYIFNTSSIAKIEIAYKDWPEWIDYRTMKPAPYTARPPNMTLLQMWDLLEGPGGVREILKKDLGLQETHQAFTSLSWFKSFLIYMHYTDGIQVVRTIRQTNPWAANEPQNFAAFQKAYTSLLNARITQRVAADNQVIVVDGYKYMLSAIGYLNKAVWEGWQPERWATRIATEALPRLCKLVTGSSKSCAYRWRPASYGGSPSNLTYNAKVTGNLGRQLYQLQQNPYLVVRASTSVAQDSVRIHYYHPDPLHLNSKLESRVDPALWKLMKTTNYSANPALLKEHGAKLTQGLIYETLKRHSGKPIGNTIRAENLNENQSALSLLRDILAIHPFYEFNDRIAYFLMAVIELESSGATGSSWSYGNVRAPFISDFALLSSLGQYQTQLTSETAAMNTLRGELFVEWLRGLGSKKPQYFTLPAWGRYVDTALAPLRAGKHIEFNDSDYELIRVGRFGELMERKVGPQWFTYYT